MFESLPGFRELYPEDCSRRNHLFRIFRKIARTFAFREYDAPVLEPLDLYVEKSGEEIVNQLFHFTDRGNRQVALRPELTPSLARMVAARSGSLRRPIKWFNVGEHFRYERPQKGRLRAFHQFNADILGEVDVAVDAELIALLVAIFRACGLGPNDFRIRLSDRVTWALFLTSLSVTVEQRPALLEVIDKSGRRKREQTLESIEQVLPGRAKEIFQAIDEMKGVTDFETLRKHLNSFGDEGKVRADEWDNLLKLLEAHGAGDCVGIDLSVVRGLAYYTGFVYEAFETSGDSRALAGGGRYDHLIKKLSGNVDLAAAGFAIGDVTLADCLETKNLMPDYIDAPEIFVVAEANERHVALRDVTRLRQAGHAAVYALKAQSFSKQFKEAGRSGAKFALVYGEEEVAADQVKIKDLSSGAEQSVDPSVLLPTLQSLEESGGIPAES